MVPKETQENEIIKKKSISLGVNYPKIRVCVSTQKEPPGVLLTVILQETKKVLEKRQTFQLPEKNGKLDLSKITPFPSLMPNLDFSGGKYGDKNKITLEWRNPNSLKNKPLQLHIFPEGDLVVKSIGKDKTVQLTTTASITTQDPIEAKNLSLNARQVFVKSSIDCSVLQIVGGRKNEKVVFANSGKIITKALRLTRITEATNTGTILVYETLKCAAQYFENLGRISAKEASFTLKYRFVNTKSGVLRFDKLLRLDCNEGLCKNAGWLIVKVGGATQFVKDFRNSGHYISEGPVIIFADGRVRNKGPLVSKNVIKIFSEQSLVNADEASICSEGPAELFSKSRIRNYNKIKSGAVSINTLDFENLQKASMIADRTLSVSSLKKIKNKGFLGGKVGVYIETLGDFAQFLKGSVESLDALTFKVHGTLSNEGSLVSQHKLDILAKDIIRNIGLLKAPIITVHSECILDNLMQGIILAGEKLNLFSQEMLENNGVILSNGSLNVEAGKILKNLKDGKMAAYGDMLLLAGHILSNAGKILGDNKVTLQAAHWFENALGGEIASGRTLTVKSGYRLDNFGKLEGKNKLYAEALEILHNHQTGIISTQESLEAVSKWALKNDGILHSEGTLKLEVDLILENCRGGRITAFDSLQLLNASLIKNSGEILSKKSVLAQAKSVLHNLHSGVIKGIDAINLLANFAFENSGQLLSERIQIEARNLFRNCFTGGLYAERELNFSSEFVLNLGEAYSQDSLIIKADTIRNFASGGVTAENAIMLIAQHHIEQAGKATAKKVDISALTLSQHGSMNVETLALNIQEVFKLHKCGHISASNAVTVLTKNLILLGQLRGKGEFRLEASENFEYGSDTLWACGLLRLILHKDYSFETNMNILGALNLESPMAINVLAPIHVAQNSDIIAKILMIEKEGRIYSANDLSFHAKESIHSTRKIETGGKVSFTTPKITFQGEHASLIVSKDCVVHGDFTSHYANIQIGGQFHHRGALVVRSHEADRRGREIERARRKAERRRDEGFFRSILSSVVSIAASCFLGPIGPVALSFGKFGFLAQGAISGGLGAAVAGRDPIEGVVSSAGFALFGNVARNALVTMRVSPGALHEAILAGSSGVLDTCIRGGNPLHNVLCRAGSTALAHSVFPSSNELQPIFSQSQILQEVGKTIGRSLIINTCSKDLSKTRLGENMMQATLDGLQSFVNAQAQEYAHQNRNLSLRDRLNHMQETDVFFKGNNQHLPENDKDGTFFVLPVYRRRRQLSPLSVNFKESKFKVRDIEDTPTGCYSIPHQNGAEENIVNDFSMSVVRGIGNFIGGLINTWRHPLDNIVYPVRDFMHDVAIVNTHNSINIVENDPSGLLGDQALLAQVIKRDPIIYYESSKRLRSRVDNFKAIPGSIAKASWQEQVEMASELAAGIFVPGAVFKYVKPLVFYKNKPLPKFKNRAGWWDKMPPMPEKIDTLSTHQIRALRARNNEPLMYVINRDNKLIITQQKYDHWHLGQKKPVYAAGDIYIDRFGFIERIDNRSGSYAPQGKHLKEFVENTFVDNGFKEARNTFSYLEDIENLEKWEKLTFRGLYKEFGFTASEWSYRRLSSVKPRIIKDDSIWPYVVFAPIGISPHSSVKK